MTKLPAGIFSFDVLASARPSDAGLRIRSEGRIDVAADSEKEAKRIARERCMIIYRSMRKLQGFSLTIKTHKA